MEYKTTLDKASKNIISFFNSVDKYLHGVKKIQSRIKNGVDPKSLVTQVDVEVQSMFEGWVSENFGGHVVIGEEKDQVAINPDWIWYIDPIDGTCLFSRCIEEWGIIISLTHKNLPILSWIYFPYTKTVYFSGRDDGSYRNGTKIQTSCVNAVKDSIISGVYLNTLDREAIMLGQLWKESLWGIIGRSLAKDFCDLAEGKIDIAVCYQCNSWEYKALSLLVEEAGGVCSGFEKFKFNALETSPQNLLAFSNQKLMKVSLKLLKIPPALI